MPVRSETAAIGLYLSGVDLECLLIDLARVGVRNEEVCAMLPRSHPAARALLDSGWRRHALGGAAESELPSEWITQFGAVIIPGAGAFVGGREFVSILFGSENCGMAQDTALQRLGFPQDEVERHLGWISGCGVVIYVSCKTEDRVHHAIEVLEEAGAEEVSRLDTQTHRLAVVPLLRAS